MLCACSHAELVKGRVPNIIAAMMAPEMRPKVRTVFFIVLVSLKSFQIPDVKIALAPSFVVILSGELRIFQVEIILWDEAESTLHWRLLTSTSRSGLFH